MQINFKITVKIDRNDMNKQKKSEVTEAIGKPNLEKSIEIIEKTGEEIKK